MPLTDLPDTIDLDFDEVGLPDDGRHEPLFTAAAPPRADIRETMRLDPTRIDFAFDPAPPGRRFWRGPIGSLLVHLLPLLILIGWPGTPLDIQRPIPIQLVVEPPPPPPPPAKAAAPPRPASPPKGTLASDDMAPVNGPKVEKHPDATASTQGEPQTPAPEAQSAAAPKPQPPVPETQPAEASKPPSQPKPQLSSALQPPAPTPPDLPSVPADPDENLATAPQSPSAETKMAAVTPPAPVKPAPLKPQAAARPPPKLEGWPLPIGAERPRELPRTASIVGPDASRDEYCAYVLTLVMRHINLVPLSLLGARHGDTYVRIRVLQDGTVSSAQVEQGSGYADIDDKIAAMVTAAGHFPPLPQWIPGPSIDFTFHLHFPHPAER